MEEFAGLSNCGKLIYLFTFVGFTIGAIVDVLQVCVSQRLPECKEVPGWLQTVHFTEQRCSKYPDS
jgi:hypothetical protein